MRRKIRHSLVCKCESEKCTYYTAEERLSLLQFCTYASTGIKGQLKRCRGVLLCPFNFWDCQLTAHNCALRYVYKWINPQDPAKKLPTLQLIPPSAAANRIPRRPGIQAYNRVETLPGLNQFVGTEKLASESLGPLLSWARAVIPTKTQAQSPVFLFATGGVRALPVKDRETLMAGVQTVLKASGLK